MDSDLSFGTDQIAVSSFKSLTTHQILTGALNVSVDKIDGARQMATRVGIVMHRLGWEKRRDNHGARLWRYWRPTKKAAEELSNTLGEGWTAVFSLVAARLSNLVQPLSRARACVRVGAWARMGGRTHASAHACSGVGRGWTVGGGSCDGGARKAIGGEFARGDAADRRDR